MTDKPPLGATADAPKVKHHVYVEATDWWCPEDGRWTMCPGPCPDGTPHEQTRQVQVPVRLGPHPRLRQSKQSAHYSPSEVK